MNVNILPLSMSSIARRAGLLLLSTVFAVNSAHADQQDITLSNTCNGNTDLSYASQPNQVVNNEVIGVGGAAGNVEWSIDGVEQTCTLATANTILCAGLTITVPTGSVSQATKVTIAGTSGANVTEGKFTLRVGDGTNSCPRKYIFRVTAKGGGWGDPHMTTIDDVHYDFQSAGEFTALREEGFEVQTRQTAVPTASIPSPNPYTGLASCVSIYTAVAARIGKNRVTLQPDASGEPSPNRGLQLRVNGPPVNLGDNGIDLPGDQPGALAGRIVRVAGGAYQITDARGTQLVVTPTFWDSQQKWYLNVNVNQTTATAGVMGRLAERSWLPALPNGTSLGGMPDSLNERYQQLYEQFADAWRVTDATSLFDYAPGTNTATFTLDEWPRSTPKSCAIEGQTSEQPATPAVAVEACKGVTDAAQRADCVFDVTFTGNTGFGQSYVAMQNIPPSGTGWQPPLATQIPPPPPPPPDGWPWWIWILILIILLIIIALILRKKTA